MSFAYYTVDTGVEASQIFWSHEPCRSRGGGLPAREIDG
jgi:hypothetical protein